MDANSIAKLLFLLPIASFGLAVGALASKFSQKDKGAKAHLLTALLIFVVLGTGSTVFFNWLERTKTATLAEEVVTVIGNQKRTYDEILSDLKNPDRQALNAALDGLDEEKRIGSQVPSITDKADDRVFRVRVFYVRTFAQ